MLGHDKRRGQYGSKKTSRERSPAHRLYIVSLCASAKWVTSRTSQKAPKGAPFSVLFTGPTDRMVDEEAKRTRRSQSAIVESLTDEAIRMRRFAGIGFRGEDAARRPWVIGSGLDIWEIIQMLGDFGSIKRLVEETQLTERQARLAIAYRDSYPRGDLGGGGAEPAHRRGVARGLPLHRALHRVIATIAPAARCKPRAGASRGSTARGWPRRARAR
jgi:hypothetical protein